MSDAPWIKFYPSDWIVGVAGLSAAERGVYITLLSLMYESGDSVERDDTRLARQCGLPKAGFVRSLAALIAQQKIAEIDGRLFSERAKSELTERANRIATAKISAKSRWQKDKKKQRAGDANAYAEAMQKQCERNAKSESDIRIDNSSLRSELSAALLSENSPSRSPQVENSKRRVWTGAELDKLAPALREAAGCPGSQNPSAGLLNLSPILGLIDQGADFESEILPAIRAKPKPDVRSWAWFIPQIQDFRAKRQAARDAPLPDISENRGQVAHHQHKTPMAQNAQPTLEDRQAAEEFGLSIEAFRNEWVKFRDHYLANGLVMADWRASWRSWLRKSKDFSRAPMRGQPLSTPETGWAIWSKRLANYKDMQNERASSAPMLAVIGDDSGDTAEQGLLHSAGCDDERHGNQRVRLLHPAIGGAERGRAAAHEQPEDLSPRTPEERAKSESCRSLIQNVLGLSLVASGR